VGTEIVIVSSSPIWVSEIEFSQTIQKIGIFMANFLSEIRRERVKMQNVEMKVDANEKSKVKHLRLPKCASSPIRVDAGAREKLTLLLKRANKQKLGRRIKAGDLIRFSLELLTDAHLEAIRNQVLTNIDRMELLYRNVSKERRGITRDEFFGLLLDGKVTL
jgi:hypothetical protein